MPARPQKPEVLAPAGSPESLRAALWSGADAVYFGLQDGFNARARAANFSLRDLPETVATALPVLEKGASAFFLAEYLARFYSRGFDARRGPAYI